MQNFIGVYFHNNHILSFYANFFLYMNHGDWKIGDRKIVVVIVVRHLHAKFLVEYFLIGNSLCAAQYFNGYN